MTSIDLVAHKMTSIDLVAHNEFITLRRMGSTMSESQQRQTGNKVGGNAIQRSDAEKATQVVESSEIAGSLTQESLRGNKDRIEDVLKQILASLENLGLTEDDRADVK